MKVDQNQPGTWVGIGVILIIVGAVVAGATESGVGGFLVGAGVLLAIVGLVVFAVRAAGGGSNK